MVPEDHPFRSIPPRMTYALDVPFSRYAETIRGIKVAVDGHKVTLSGTVRSWYERESAEQAATHARGITEVDNQIAVDGPDPEDLHLDTDDPQC